jgi:hypothetical protein
VQRSASLIFNRTVIDFGTTQRNQQVARVIQVDNLGRIPSDFRVDWAERVPWASFEIYGNPREAFPIAVRVRIDTSGLPYGRHLLELVFTAAGRTTQIPVIVHVQDPARSPVPPNQPPKYSAPRNADGDPLSNLRAASVPVIVVIAAVICQMMMSMAENARNSGPSPTYSTLPAVSELLVTPTRTPRSPTRQPITTGPSGTAKPPKAEPRTTPQPFSGELPDGWQPIPEDYLDNDANWVLVHKIESDDVSLDHTNGVFHWSLAPWVARDWMMLLKLPSETKGSYIKTHVAAIRGGLIHCGLVFGYQNDQQFYTVSMQPGTYAGGVIIERYTDDGKTQLYNRSITGGHDSWRVSVLALDNTLSVALDGRTIFEIPNEATDGGVGLYANIQPPGTGEVSFDEVQVAVP